MLFRLPPSYPTGEPSSRGARSAFTVRCWLCALWSAWLAAALVASNLSGAEPAAIPKGKAAAAPTADQLEFFEKKIRPVLAQHCYSCHSEESRQVQANLWLDTRDGIRRGGDSGPSVVPGKPAESQLLDALRFESFEMPPSGKLSDAVIADFEKWIAMGAPDPREGKAVITQDIDLEQGRRFWAFRPLQFTVPTPADDWPRSDIDRFLLAAMHKAGLEPVADADRRTLIRRAYFDLLGLPPTPQEVEKFVADKSPEAFAQLVDRLLALPAFGERWGRHWLDVARFAESSGGGRPLLFPNAWRYRDYIIRAFNTDKPFDRFVQEHLAGDLISGTPAEQADGLTAAGFLALGPHNYETQDKELLRMDIVDEQLDTIGKAMLGLTIGCARCHDHKFDPIPTRDYYALAGIFRSTKSLTPGNVSGWVEQMLPLKPEHEQAIQAFEAAKAPLEQQLKKLQAQLKRLDAQLPPPSANVTLAGIVLDNVQAELVGSWQESSSNRSFVGLGYIHDQNQAKGAKRVIYRAELPAAGQYEVRVTYSPGSNRATNVPITIEHAGGEAGVNIDQKKQPPIDGVSVSLGKFSFAAGQRAVVTIGTEGTSGVVIADAVQFLPTVELAARPQEKPAADPVEKARQAEIRAQREATNAQLTQLQSKLAALQKKAPNVPKVMCVQDEAETGDYKVCIRGNVHNLGADVPRGFLQVLSQESPTIPAGQSGRLELAAWLTSAENPLPARVMVNRIWQHLFAHGLVRTVDNFGVMGDRPSHDQLLDYLAARFKALGWSTKQVIREIMLSRAYQLESAASPAALRADPENRLLSHQNRRRVQGEVLRDTVLVLAGQLEPKFGGPSMRPGTTAELGYEFREHWRSVYLPVFRDTPMDVLEVFDFADPNVVQGQRNVSTRSTQALLMMNSPFIIDRAQASAAELLAQPELSLGDRIDYVYQSALGRSPHSAERELSREYLQPWEKAAVEPRERLAQWTRFYQAVWSSIDFRYVD